MITKTRTWLSLLVALMVALMVGPIGAYAATTINLSPGANLTTTVETANSGDVIQLADGVYTSNAAGGSQVFPDKTTFMINKQGITIRGNIANPAAVILQASAVDYSVRFAGYIDTANQPADVPHGATLEGVTIQGSPYGILVDNYTIAPAIRLTDITIRNVIIQATGGGGVVAGGVSTVGPQRLVMDNVTVTASGGEGFNLRNTIDSVLMNSRVTTASTGLFVHGGQGNVIVNNTFGNVPAVNGVTLQTSGAAFQNTRANRFEGNTVQGFRTDGLVFFNTNTGDTTLQATDNYAGKNTIISNGFAATLAGVPARDHGTGIWVNCGANNSWVYGNDVQGGPEAGLTIWSAKSNVLLGNATHDNEDAGVFVAGGPSETYSFCNAETYRIKSTNNTVQSNAIFYNKVDSVVIRDVDFTDVIMNVISPANGLGGANQVCQTSECQSAISLEGPELAVNNSRVLRNTLAGARRGLWVNFNNIFGLEFFGNRTLGSVNNRLIQPSTFPTLDWGAALGGNHWSQHTLSGNPGSTPFTGISHNSSNNINGPVSDRFPFQSESFGITQMSVAEPYAGDYAVGSLRTVRWNALGCTYVDISLDGTVALKTNHANTGYAVVTIPSTSLAAHSVRVACKNSAGTATGQTATSPSFTVRSAELTLLTPGRDDVFNAGAAIPVAWKRTSFTGAVTIEYSIDNGTTFTQVPGSTTYTGNFAYVTLPTVAASAYARLRISSGVAMDTTDGVYAIRGTSPGFKNVASGRSFTMGRLERLEWASPANSRLVTLTYNTGSGSKTVVGDFPDRGSYDWIVPDIGTTSSLVLTVVFKTSNDIPISSVASSTAAAAYAGTGGPFTLSVTALGSGTVTSSPAGINCPPTCEVVFPLNTAVTLSATPGSGSQFFGYSGSCTGATCSVSMSAARGAVASFHTGTLATRYRLYSPGTFEHLYTTDFNEYSVLPVCCAWVAEGTIYKLLQGPGSYGGVAAVPYFRLYNPLSFQHHWTTDTGEYNFLPSVGWRQEGIDGYILPSAIGGALPLYRLYLNAVGGLHLWTTDANERDYLVANAAWVDEGIAGYVLPLP